jgi:hypothetical protein
MSISGSGFFLGAAVLWNAAVIPTNYVSGIQLTGLVAANLIAAPGTAVVTVVNLGGATSKPVSLTINSPGISISPSGIVNSASYAGDSVSPGEIVVIYGSGLGPDTLATAQLDSRGYVSTSLSGTQVMFDGMPAPIIYTQTTNVSVVVPYEVGRRSVTQVQVVYQGQVSNTVSVPVSTVMPGIFTADSSGHGQGSIVNQDGTVNSATNAAHVGRMCPCMLPARAKPILEVSMANPVSRPLPCRLRSR